MPLQMTLDERLCQPHYGSICQSLSVCRLHKSTRGRVKMQHSVCTRTVIPFRTEIDGNGRSLVRDHVEAYRIHSAIFGKPRAAGVSEIAGRLQLGFRRAYGLVTRRSAASFVAIAERKPRAMRPQFRFATFLRNEVRTSQGLLRRFSHCKAAGCGFDFQSAPFATGDILNT